MAYPEKDTNFTETVLTAVAGNKESGWNVTREDGWSMYIPGTESGIDPTIGTAARIYESNGMIRGIFLDGIEVFYRTVEEDKEQRDIAMYGADAADWLKRWDEGQSVWSVEMGGLGPGYEQCIQIVTAEAMRFWMEHNYSADELVGNESLSNKLDDHFRGLPLIANLGLSGAQHGAGVNLAWQIFSRGPRDVMADENIQDRKILVSKTFPQG